MFKRRLDTARTAMTNDHELERTEELVKKQNSDF